MANPSEDLKRLRTEYEAREHRPSLRNRYTIFEPAFLYLIQQRQRDLVHMWSQLGIHSLDSMKILEIGCAEGNILYEFLGYQIKSKQLHGVDYLAHSLNRAKGRFPAIPLMQADGQKLPFTSNSFDIVLQYTMFTSLLDSQIKQNIAQEMLRVVNKQGVIIWYDFWFNPTNPQTRGIRKAEIKALFPNCEYLFKRVTLAPPIARKTVPISWQLSRLLEQLRIFNSHYLVAIRPNN